MIMITVPGHHFQLSVAQTLKGLPFFRRVVPFTGNRLLNKEETRRHIIINSHTWASWPSLQECDVM
jgi:hypothetical protein